MTKLIAKYAGYYSLANLSADGKRGVTLTKKKYREHVVVFDTAKGRAIAEYPLTNYPYILAISPDGNTVVCNDRETIGGIPQEPEFANFMIVWNIEKNTTQKFLIKDIQHSFEDIAWITNAQFAILSWNGGSFWDVYKGETIPFTVGSRMGGGDYLIYQKHLMVFEHDIHKTTLFYIDGLAVEIPKRMFLWQQSIHSAYIPTRGLAISPNGKLCAILHNEEKSLRDDPNVFKNKVAVWDMVNQQAGQSLVGERELSALAWSPDSTRLLVSELNHANKTSQIVLWNAVTGQKQADFTQIDGFVDNIIWHGERVYISTQNVYVDPVLTVWDGK
jgi:WD40 repeat protein